MSKQAAMKEVIQQKGGWCGTSCGCGDSITSNLYGADETDSLPDTAVAASLGCGNPTALIELADGQTVLDLGSGGGIDVLLSAKRVGPRGTGFESVEVEPWRVYELQDAKHLLTEGGLDVAALAGQVEGKIASAFIRAARPAAVRADLLPVEA